MCNALRLSGVGSVGSVGQGGQGGSVGSVGSVGSLQLLYGLGGTGRRLMRVTPTIAHKVIVENSNQVALTWMQVH